MLVIALQGAGLLSLVGGRPQPHHPRRRAPGRVAHVAIEVGLL